MTSNPYDEIPYASYAFPLAHIERLAMVGRLLGIPTAPPNSCTVLEIGCANGGNLLPMAVHYPDSRFLGIDLSRKQIEMARSRIEQDGLNQVEVRQQSLTDLQPEDGQFDYVIVHGVYAWVDEDVRGHVLRCCRENLAPNGIAFVSYNTKPGWNSVQSLRDLMLFHLEPMSDPHARSQEARSLLRFLRQALAETDTAYGRFVREECDLLLGQSPRYLAHDHLEDVNQPVYFLEFMEQVRGLQYLADAHLPSMHLANLGTVAARELEACSNLLLREQYMDYLTNRRFRCSLLVHPGHQVLRDLNAIDVSPFNLSADVAFDPSEIDGDEPATMTVGKVQITVTKRCEKTALTLLETEGRMPFVQLVSQVEMMMGARLSESEQGGLMHLMAQLVLADGVQLNYGPKRHQSVVGDRPEMWWYARAEALRDHTVTNLYHRAMQMSQAQCALAQLLDGTHSREELEDAAIALEQAELVALGGESLQEKLKAAELWVATQLEIFARHCYLV
ncbi:MAG: class I SAM-dependent methyltransferase [Acidobacteria bacterium]|nr:class I SAM-dependent methyltransferase [Acidobacteriota bacterium]